MMMVTADAAPNPLQKINETHTHKKKRFKLISYSMLGSQQKWP